MKTFNKVSLVIVLAFSFVFGFAGPSTTHAAGPSGVNLGSAGNFTILGKTGISTTGTTAITGNIGVSPAAATYITGFGLTMDSSNVFSTSSLVTGKVYASDYTPPTPTTMTTAISDMETAYTDAAGRTNPTAVELGAGNIGGMTLAPGIYKWGTDVTIPTDVTLSGSANDVWIFQIAQNLSLSSGVHIVLSGGAQAANIFWQVAGQTTLGTTSVLNGNVLDQTSIVLNTGATLNGRALAQAAVTLDSNSVNTPSFVSVISTPVIFPISTPSTGGTAIVNPLVAPAPVVTSTPIVTSTPVVTTDAGCLTGNIFSTTTGKNCNSASSVVSNSMPVASNFGQQVKMITTNFVKGARHANVRTLQEFLISQDKGPRAKALSANGTTLNFGSLTKAALAEWQKSVGITPALGNFGPITRAFISAHY